MLVDSPPAASLSDATLLAGFADMVILVVRHNHTDRDIVARTVQQLKRVGANLAGVVLNNVTVDRAFAKDYYYYSADGPSEGRASKRKATSGEAGAGA